MIVVMLSSVQHDGAGFWVGGWFWLTRASSGLALVLITYHVNLKGRRPLDTHYTEELWWERS